MKKHLWAQRLCLVSATALLVVSCNPPPKPPKAPPPKDHPCDEEEAFSDFFEDDTFDTTVTGESTAEERNEMLSEEHSSADCDEVSEQESLTEDSPVSLDEMSESVEEQAEATLPSAEEPAKVAEGEGTPPQEQASNSIATEKTDVASQEEVESQNDNTVRSAPAKEAIDDMAEVNKPI